MLPDTNSFSGWHTTDDEAVPVHSSGAPAPEKAEVSGPAHDIQNGQTSHVVIGAHDHPSRSKGMTLSAALGVLIAIGGVGAYLGLGDLNLRGDLTGGTANDPITIKITESGNFDPVSAEIHPGQSVTIENENTDPQVLKPKNNRELFPVQVVFDQPYTFTVPLDALGPYIYYSETLPDDRTVTLTVLSSDTPIPFGTTEETPIPFASNDVIPIPFENSDVIPIPFGSSQSSSLSSSSSSSFSSSSSSSSGGTGGGSGGGSGGGGGGGGGITITVGTTRPTGIQSGRPSNSIPTNPYTVANAPRPSVAAATATLTDAHEGAPLLANSIRTPVRTPDSGMGGFMLLFIPALLGVTIVSRKLTQV